MNSHQRQQAIANVQERIDVLLAFHADHSDSIAQSYRAKLAENIVDAVLALTAERTPEDLQREATAMLHARERFSRLRKAEKMS